MVDVNGTRFLLFQSEADWKRAKTGDGEPVSGSSKKVRWNAQRNEVTLEPEIFRFPPGRGDRPVQIDDRRGAARDRFGNWYWIAPDSQSVLVRSVVSGKVSSFWPSPDAGDARDAADRAARGEFAPRDVLGEAALPLQGLAITEDHYLLVGIQRPAGVLIVDLYSGGAAGERLWFPEVESAFEPFDLAAREGGGVWILGRRDKRVWELDRRFELVAQSPAIAPTPDVGGFAAADGTPRDGDSPPRWERSKLGWQIPAEDPIAIASLPGHGVLVLDRVSDTAIRVHWLERRAARGSASDTEPVVRTANVALPPPARVTAHDLALTPRGADDPERWAGRLYVVDGEGNQAYAFGVDVDGSALTLHLINAYYPMRLFGGRALITVDGDPWYDCAESWVKLVHQNRPRYKEAGDLITPQMDSGEPGCVWHRLMIDGCIASGAEVDLFTRCSDDSQELPTLEWHREPRPYLRGDGSELPFSVSLPPQERGDDRGTWESLFQGARGRYLQVKLTFRGDGRTTPRIRAMRVWYPRFSYLERYLPAVYREDVESASFVDRFLANFEGIFTTVEERIAAAHVLFDVESAPRESLDWLGRWFGVALDPSWEESRRRLFIRHATEFFAARGTMRGLHLALRLALDDCVDEKLFDESPTSLRGTSPVRIVEKFRTRGARRGLPDTVETSDPQRDTVLWRDFLARRHRSVKTMNAAWRARWPSFASVPLPARPLRTPAQRVDWSDFQRVVLAMHRTAHRFTVMLPIPVHMRGDTPAQRRRRAVASKVLELEKPAHTVFDMRFYWAMFRVGEARIGDGTVIGEGSRSADLMAPMVLGEGYLAEAFLSAAPGRDAPTRFQTGRERVGRSARLGGP